MRADYILSLLNEVAVLFPTFLLVFTFRGFFQALIAKLMGDDTAQRDGFLTLNPLAHVDLIGLTVVLFVIFLINNLFTKILPRGMLLLLLIAVGARWTIPIPIDDNNFKWYKLGGIISSLAGSLGNFFLAFFMLILIRFFAFDNLPKYILLTLVDFFKAVIDISIFFGILDLIPLPPFDGGRILKYMLPYNKRYIVDWLKEYSLFIILILFFMPGISDIFWGGINLLHVGIKKQMFRILF